MTTKNLTLENIEIILPAMGEGITEATIMRWLVSEGTTVKENQPLVEIATDKVDSEIPSPADGVLKKILRKEGQVTKVGESLAIISVNGSEEISSVEKIETSLIPPVSIEVSIETEHRLSLENNSPKAEESIPYFFIPPYVRLMAKETDISLAELFEIHHNIKGRIISKSDLISYLTHKRNNGYKSEFNPTQPETPVVTHKDKTEVFLQNSTIEPMSRMRKLIASHMTQSSKTIPHVTSFIEVDVSQVVQWREKVMAKFSDQYNVKLTLTPIFIEAAVQAIQAFPGVNVSVDEDNIIRKNDINIGMATILPDSNLIVPVIKNADKMNLAGLAQAITDLSERARENLLKPNEISGSTFTITNIGVFGTLTGTPIINYPEAAILAIGTITKKPYVVNISGTNTIGIRDIVMLSLAYDHRVIDGGLGGKFLKHIADSLTNFNLNRDI